MQQQQPTAAPPPASHRSKHSTCTSLTVPSRGNVFSLPFCPRTCSVWRAQLCPPLSLPPLFTFLSEQSCLALSAFSLVRSPVAFSCREHRVRLTCKVVASGCCWMVN